MLAELPRPHPLFFPQLLIASLPKSLSAQWQRCLKAFQICNLIALGRTLVHFQNRCIRLYNSALQKKKKKKARPILSNKSASRWSEVHSKRSNQVSPKNYRNTRYASAALRHHSAHTQAVDLESSLDQKQNPLATLLATLFMYTQHRGGREVAMSQRWQSSNKYNSASGVNTLK